MTDDELDRLAARARAGDRRAFEALVRRLARPALAMAWELVSTREDAEDLVQETFTRTWRELGRYDAARPFAPWFFTILRNAGRSARRRDRRWSAAVPLSDEVVDAEAARLAGEPDPGLEVGPDVVERVHAALGTLPAMQRACFRLTALEGFTSAQAGAMLGVSDATVRVHAHRARKALRARFGETETEEDR